jgi:hypothetical protein
MVTTTLSMSLETKYKWKKTRSTKGKNNGEKGILHLDLTVKNKKTQSHKTPEGRESRSPLEA